MTTFEECVREYAGYWTGKENWMVSGLQSTDVQTRLNALQKAAGYFRIARSFRNAYDVDKGLPRLAPLLAVLEHYRTIRIKPDSLIAAIEDARVRLGAPYGGRNVLSAATKLLWMLHKAPVIIFDSQVRIALGTAHGDYESYVRAWRAGYDSVESDVRDACSFALGASKDHVTTDWFRQRVYDIYLWRAGAPSTNDTSLRAS
jgi:hypothetical protein